MITAIIVNYHTSHLLSPLLTQLESDPLVDSVIVADNSHEQELPSVLNSFLKTRLLVFDLNIGFAAAVNRAAAMAKSKYWLLLNPDIRLCKDTLTELVSAAEKSGSVLAGPRYYWDDHRNFRFPPASGYSLWFRGGDQAAARFPLDAELLSFQTEALFQRHWDAKEPFIEPFLNGACLLICKDSKFFPDSKIFDEQFFMYFEDTDLCSRMMLLGEFPVCVPTANAIHYWDQAPSDRKAEMMASSEQIFLGKYYGTEIPQWNIPDNNVFEISDLGSLREPPVFLREENRAEGPMFLDFGINPYFRPFARADFDGQSFEFPSDIFSRLTKGLYFTRILTSGVRPNRSIYRWRKG